MALDLEQVREPSMRKFFSIVLALALGFLVTIALSYVSKGLSAPSDVGIGNEKCNYIRLTSLLCFP